ncbi:acetyltransferase [Paenibacillus hodogayensis]|uniref:Acetyltransferase n=1 Tax=Paenibacillus hodogayensis TaxID=279208 RepID=A0ABV5W8E4_9BACL
MKTKTKNKIVIIGAGGLGKGIAQLINDLNKVEDVWELVGFLDDDPSLRGKMVNNYPILGKMDLLADRSFQDVYVMSAIGDSSGRIQVLRKALEINHNLRFPSLIHPTAIVGEETEIGEGTSVGAYAIVEPSNRIGSHVLVHYGTTIGHDCVIEDFATVLPGTNVSGFVKLCYGTYLGTNVSVLPGVEVGTGTIVGAGATVIHSLPANCTAVGVPAKLIKFHDEVFS